MNDNSSRAWRAVRVAALVAAVLLPATARAQSAPDLNEVLVENRWAKITRGDYEVELLRLPPDLRGGFAFDAKRVTDLLVRMLVSKSLAVQARASDLYKDAELQRRRALELDRVDASLLISKTEEEAAARFDAAIAKSDARLRELYAVNVGSYKVPEQISASHILFDVKTRSKELALKARAGNAGEARRRRRFQQAGRGNLRRSERKAERWPARLFRPDARWIRRSPKARSRSRTPATSAARCSPISATTSSSSTSVAPAALRATTKRAARSSRRSVEDTSTAPATS